MVYKQEQEGEDWIDYITNIFNFFCWLDSNNLTFVWKHWLLKWFKYYSIWLLKSDFVSVTEENSPNI